MGTQDIAFSFHFAVRSSQNEERNERKCGKQQRAIIRVLAIVTDKLLCWHSLRSFFQDFGAALVFEA